MNNTEIAMRFAESIGLDPSLACPPNPDSPLRLKKRKMDALGLMLFHKYRSLGIRRGIKRDARKHDGGICVAQELVMRFVLRNKEMRKRWRDDKKRRTLGQFAFDNKSLISKLIRSRFVTTK